MADASEGIRQSPRGEREPPATTLGPFGSADRLNWLAKNQRSSLQELVIMSRALVDVRVLQREFLLAISRAMTAELDLHDLLRLILKSPVASR